MQCLEETIGKNTVSDCKDLSMDIKIYSKMWLAIYGFLKVFSEPKYSHVRDIVKINGVIGKLIDQCIISERSEYSEKIFELRCKITKEGIIKTDISIINGEAAEPLHPASIFHSFKKIIGEIRKYFNDIGITVKGYIYTRLRLRLLIIS